MRLEAKNTRLLPDIEGLEIYPIDPRFLASFLRNRKIPLRIDYQRLDYGEIFGALRKLPLGEQEDLLVNFFEKGTPRIPNFEILGKSLARTNSIHWFEPKKDPDVKLLQQFSDNHLERLNLNTLPLKTIRVNWSEALNLAEKVSPTRYNELWIKAHQTAYRGRSAAWETAIEIAGKMARQALSADYQTGAPSLELGAAGDVVRQAAWIVVDDLMKEDKNGGYTKGNPWDFDALMGIYQLGCWPLGILKDSPGPKKPFSVKLPLPYMPDKPKEKISGEFVIFIPQFGRPPETSHPTQ